MYVCIEKYIFKCQILQGGSKNKCIMQQTLLRVVIFVREMENINVR